MRPFIALFIVACARETTLVPRVDPRQEGAEHPDADGDGFSVLDGDCDDANADVFPGQTEVCGDGIDQNCDGSANGCRHSGTVVASQASEAIFQGDRLVGRGGSSIALGDANGDGWVDLLISDPYRGVSGRDSSGAAHLFHGPFHGTKLYSQAESHWNGALPSRIVGKTVSLADYDADGVDDVVVGHETYTSLWRCPCAGGYDLQLDRPTRSWDAPIRLIGDVDGDGVEEYLSDNGRILDLATDREDAILPDRFALADAADDLRGDLDGDGVDDLVLVRAIDILVDGSDLPIRGSQVGILRGPLSGEVPFSAIQLTPPIPSAIRTRISVGDANGDARLDLALNHQILAGPEFRTTLATVKIGEDGGCEAGIEGEQATCSLVFVGDVDGDGLEDALLHDFDYETIEAKAALFHGPLSGELDFASAGASLVSDDRLPRVFPGPKMPPYLVFYDSLADGAARASGVVWVVRPGW